MVGEELQTFWVPVIIGQRRKCGEKQELGAKLEGELSQRPNKLRAQHTASCIYKEQSDISSICTREGRTNVSAGGKGTSRKPSWGRKSLG